MPWVPRQASRFLHHSARRSSVFSQARQTLDRLETQYAEEELTRAEERARLDEAWALLRERVESYRRQDGAAETMEQLDAAREALEAETVSKHQEIAPRSKRLSQTPKSWRTA